MVKYCFHVRSEEKDFWNLNLIWRFFFQRKIVENYLTKLSLSLCFICRLLILKHVKTYLPYAFWLLAFDLRKGHTHIWKIFFVLVTRLRSFFKKHLCTFMLRVFVPKVPRDFRNLNLGLLSMCKMMSYHARKVLGNNMLCEWAWSLPEPLIKHDYLFLEYFFATSSVTSLPNWHFWSWTILNLTHNKN